MKNIRTEKIKSEWKEKHEMIQKENIKEIMKMNREKKNKKEK